MNTPAPSAARRAGDAIQIPGDYQHRARSHGFVVQRFWHAEKERVIHKFSRPAPGDRILDVGCGSGVISDFLARFDTIVTGVDANPQAIAYAQRTFVRPNLDFAYGLVDELRFETESIDRVYCLELIEHIYVPQTRDLLARLHTLVKPGGVLTITTPNYRGLWPAIEATLDLTRLVPHLAGDQHVARFHATALRNILTETGWRVDRLTTFSTFAPFMSVLGWHLAQRLAEVEDRLRLPFGNVLLAVARKDGVAATPAHDTPA